MKVWPFALLLIALAVPVTYAERMLPPAEPVKKEIALSFDDVPRGTGAFYSSDERTRLLIAGLQHSRVPQVAFFVVPGAVTPTNGGEARINAYVAAGNVIADHSFSHRPLNLTSGEAYLADIDRAEAWLKGRPGYRPWFRFVGLNQGGRDKVKRQIVLDGLAARGLRVGYVTADGSDWRIEAMAEAAKKSGQPMDEAALQKLYVETMVQAADFYDKTMQRAIGRSPVHMLLLHETDLAARYIEPLVAALRADGWRIVSADQAYADPIGQLTADGPDANATLTEALASSHGVTGQRWYDRNDEPVARQLFETRVLHPAPIAPLGMK